MQQREHTLQQREEQLNERERQQAGRESVLLQHVETLANLTEKYQEGSSETENIAHKIEQRDKVINLKDTIIAQLNQQLLHKEKALQQRDAMLQKLGQQLRHYSATA